MGSGGDELDGGGGGAGPPARGGGGGPAAGSGGDELDRWRRRSRAASMQRRRTAARRREERQRYSAPTSGELLEVPSHCGRRRVGPHTHPGVCCMYAPGFRWRVLDNQLTC
jgi:hypothetical protein